MQKSTFCKSTDNQQITNLKSFHHLLSFGGAGGGLYSTTKGLLTAALAINSGE